MGSLEEERLVQMVHDFIESESSTPPMFPASSNCLSINKAKCFTLQEILGRVTEAETRVLETLLKHMRSKNDAEKTTSLKMWLVERLKMDGFIASICRTSWVTSLGCPAGAYEYIGITLKDENGGSTRLIVDIDFRSQFELARPTSLYKELTDTLPSFFAGSEDKLNKIISLLCSAARQSLTERGLHVPPWRTSSYMQSKWLSRCCDATNDSNTGYSSREDSGAENGSRHGYGSSLWTPPMVKPKIRGLGGGSSLSSQLSSVGINCC
ncbi:hypothetical protein OIU74_020936 [Salix koriyanagi]|uniref:Uncharacterized protein n=1 Tax=Salix koriyanagi TaxID=2511006 RepID=A0A9Q0P723_9ROSI|nr:hypothetical protein OIU74_020936 [Salix koriyanagi]